VDIGKIRDTRFSLLVWADSDRRSRAEERAARMVISDLEFWEGCHPHNPPRESISATMGDVIALGEAAGRADRLTSVDGTI